MKVLTLRIGDKTYTTGKITAFLSKEALKIQKDAIALGKKGQDLQANSEDLDMADNLLTDMFELKERKAWLICEVYGNKFSTDILQNTFDDEEIDVEINKIIFGVAGVISKN